MERPLRSLLDDPLDDLAVRRMWRGVVQRRTAAQRRATVLWKSLALSMVAVLGVVVVLSVLRFSAPPAGPVGVAGPLRLAGGARIGALMAGADSPRRIDLEDGSRILLAAGTRLDVLENDGRAFTALLAAGRADFEVRPGGPRRWTVECGLATVEVLGTGFVIERRGAHVSVVVRHGVVLVRGERVADRVQRLTVGQRLDLEAAPVLAAVVPPAPSVIRTPAASPLRGARPPVVTGASVGASPPDWRRLAQEGRFEQAYGALGPAGLVREAGQAGPQELLALADVARLSGHPAAAVAPLEQLVTRYADDPSAPLAAFTLGRLELDTLGRPRPAALGFQRAITLGLPRGLQEDAYARLVEARAREGDTVGARAAFQEYQLRFPQGRRAAECRRWLDDP